MRLFKVRTWVDLKIETNWLFKKDKYHCYFTYKTKYIYARDIEEARMKYGEYFFTPIEDGFDKSILKYYELIGETCSNNMEFDLAFNQQVVHTNESVSVVEKPVIVTINELRNNMIAQDFRDWWHDLKYDNLEPIDLEYDSPFK